MQNDTHIAKYYETVQEAARRQRKDLINNLHIAAWFFESDLKFFFFEKVLMLIPKWGLVDWWYRFEWQHHGSVLVHIIAKRKEAPEIDWENMKNNDSLVTTINTDLNAPPSDHHPCQKHSEDFMIIMQYKLLKGNWVECSGEYIVRMVRYRDLLSLTENHTLSWIDLYNQHLVEINDDPDDLIGPAVDDIQEVDGNDSDEEITTGVTKACYDIMKLKRQKALSNRQLVATK
ncbi:hypothetical protein RhiirA4_504942 [Rhizophagus irregularis]|uniref:Uncharacterized protein n=1 Tax=Rhizophagus irregularis TaxID=588596 RepID=A0A2I1H9R1_9GLOM|nr:hypothetical protein RhiirA4_504942 [Rhizophagus irregularis]